MSSCPLQRQQTHTSSFKATRELNRRDGVDVFGSIGPFYPVSWFELLYVLITMQTTGLTTRAFARKYRRTDLADVQHEGLLRSMHGANALGLGMRLASGDCAREGEHFPGQRVGRQRATSIVQVKP